MRFFILGSHPLLSIAELAAVLPTGTDFAMTSPDVCVLDVDEAAENLQARLAGVVKIGTIVGELARGDLHEAVPLIVSLLASEEPRPHFGFSTYRLSPLTRSDDWHKELTRLGMEVKRTLREQGRSSRFVTSKERELSAVVVTTNHLLEKGGEFVFIRHGENVLVGQTESVQDFSAWSRRDYGRPRRNAKAGMLPPKLARMMINVTGVDPAGHTLLDPFCGSGTVLMEAALLGFPRLLGSDVEERAVKDTRVNLDWLAEREGAEIPPIELFSTPANELPSLLHEPVHALVTETYLGPPAKETRTSEEISQLMRGLIELYESSFSSLKQAIALHAPAVVAFPVFFRNKKPLHLPLVKLLQGAGWSIDPTLPTTLPKTMQTTTPNGGLLYRRSDQFVGREILRIRRKV